MNPSLTGIWDRVLPRSGGLTPARKKKQIVPSVGLEPTILGLEVRCDIQFRHEGMATMNELDASCPSQRWIDVASVDVRIIVGDTDPVELGTEPRG